MALNDILSKDPDNKAVRKMRRNTPEEHFMYLQKTKASVSDRPKSVANLIHFSLKLVYNKSPLSIQIHVPLSKGPMTH